SGTSAASESCSPLTNERTALESRQVENWTAMSGGDTNCTGTCATVPSEPQAASRHAPRDWACAAPVASTVAATTTAHIRPAFFDSNISVSFRRGDGPRPGLFARSRYGRDVLADRIVRSD